MIPKSPMRLFFYTFIRVVGGINMSLFSSPQAASGRRKELRSKACFGSWKKKSFYQKMTPKAGPSPAVFTLSRIISVKSALFCGSSGKPLSPRGTRRCVCCSTISTPDGGPPPAWCIPTTVCVCGTRSKFVIRSAQADDDLTF